MRIVERAPGRPLRLGIVGFGRVAQDYYAPFLRRRRGLGPIAVADPLAASRAAAAMLLPRSITHVDPAALLDPPPDALLVASPPSAHLAIWNAASARGVPVFMEKPFVRSGELDRAERPPDAARRLMVDFNRRFWPPYAALRDALRRGGLGPVAGADLALHIDPIPWLRVTAHRHDPAEGGVLHDLGSHLLDLAAWILPEPPLTIAAEAQGPDRLRLALGLPSGGVVAIEVGYGDRAWERVDVRAAGGRLRLEDPNRALRVEAGGRAGGRLLGWGRDAAWLGYRGLRRSRSMTRFSIAAALAAFLDGVERGLPLRPGFDAAARNVRWIEAAERALATGRPVALPEERTVSDR